MQTRGDAAMDLEQALAIVKAAGYRVSKPRLHDKPVSALNAIGKPYGVLYDPKYKIKTGLTSILRLRAPQNFFHGK
jgi:hypothetical protein